MNKALDISLKNHDSELNSITRELEEIRLTINDYWFKLKKNNGIKLDVCKTRESILDILYILADFTIPIFEIRNDIEDYFTLKYKNDPDLGRVMFNKFYGGLHEKYDQHKNTCYFLLNSLEKYELGLNRVCKYKGEAKLLKKILN